MTGLPTLLVELEDAAGGFTHDVTEYVKLPRGWDYTRGRNDEDDSVEPGQLTLTLRNDDGRFTLGSPLYDGIRVDQRLRITETVAGAVSHRFTGYVQNWPVVWESAVANTASCSVTVVDRQSRFARRTLRSAVENEIVMDGPIGYYMLSEPSGATAAADSSGAARSALQLVGDSTPPVVFGNATGVGTDGLTAAQFAGSSPGGILVGQYLAVEGLSMSGAGFTLECFFNTASAVGIVPNLVEATAQVLNTVGFNSFDGTILAAVAGTILTSSNSYLDGHTHHVAVTVTPAGTTALYVDGALEDSASGGFAFPVWVFTALAVGRAYTGAISHLAVFDGVLPADRIAAHAEAGSTGFAAESAAQRMVRLAEYANVAPADQDVEPSVLDRVPAAATAGKSVIDAMRDLETAEGGIVFIAGDGRFVFHSRTHRVLTASTAPTCALQAEVINPDGLVFSADKDYLVNIANGTREGGSGQVVRDLASIMKYDEYAIDDSGLLVLADQQVIDRLQWIVATYCEVRPRLSSFTLDLLTLDVETQAAALGVELGDRVLISGWPTQAPSAVADLIVEGIKESQTHNQWTLTVNTVPAELFRAWVVGDPVYGVVGSTTKAHW